MRASDGHPTAIDLVEWETCAPEPGTQLFGRFLEEARGVRQLASQLSTAGMLDIVELRQGLSLRATSYVGRIRLGDLQITIRPKIPMMCLLRLFQYAYGLRHLKLFSWVGYGTEPQTFQDLLIHQLAAEASELLSRGLHRRYVRRDQQLSSPRGRIDISRIVRDGGLTQTTLALHRPSQDRRLFGQPSAPRGLEAWRALDHRSCAPDHPPTVSGMAAGAGLSDHIRSGSLQAVIS